MDYEFTAIKWFLNWNNDETALNSSRVFVVPMEMNAYNPNKNQSTNSSNKQNKFM